MVRNNFKQRKENLSVFKRKIRAKRNNSFLKKPWTVHAFILEKITKYSKYVHKYPLKIVFVLKNNRFMHHISYIIYT